jgi:hypothetical protein
VTTRFVNATDFYVRDANAELAPQDKDKPRGSVCGSGNHNWYESGMARAKYCLVMGGNGFDMRLFSAMLLGCVPLFTQERTSQPLQNIMRYDKFSLSCPRWEAAHVEIQLTHSLKAPGFNP